MMHKSKIETQKVEQQPNYAVKDDGFPSTQVEQNPLLGAVNAKKVEQLLVDSLIGKKVRLFKKEYSENDYDKYDSRPKYHYDTFFHGSGVSVVVCEIMGVQISSNKDKRIRLILSDNGIFGDLRGLYLNSELNFV